MKSFTLITGATSGIGLELARIAAREKRNLVLVARSEKDLKTVAKELGAPGNVVEVFAIDLSKAGAAQKVCNFCTKKKLVVAELVNNAGFGDYGGFADSDLNRQVAMINLNVSAITELTRLFLPAMRTLKAGKILNLGSVASFFPGPSMSVYFATKNYVLSFSRALSEELRGSSVTVTCLCPGATKTGFGKSAHVSATHSTANPKTTAREVAEFGWYQMQSGEPVAIYGASNRVMLQLAKLVPRNLLPRFVKVFQK